MRDQTLPPRTTSSYVRQLPAGYTVTLLGVKRADGQPISTAPHPTIREALVAAEALAKNVGYLLV